MRQFRIIQLITLALCLTPISGHAFLFAEAAVGLGFGSSKTKEFGAQTYTHDASNLGFSVDARAGFELLIFDFGATYSFGKNPAKFTKEDPGTSIFQEVRYDITLSHSLYGAHAGVNIPVINLKLFGEYYLKANSEVSYSEPKADNIFTKGDEFEGDGFGVGASLSVLPFIKFHALYRNLTFDTLKNTTGSTSLPSSSQDKLTMEMFYAGITLSI